MTMNDGIARALRRCAGMSVMAVVILAGMHEVLYADPELPPRSVDRVVVTPVGGPPHAIVDGAAVARIVDLARAHGHERIRHHREICFFEVATINFYRGDETVGHVLWEGEVLSYTERRQTISIRLSQAEAAELNWLLGVTRDREPRPRAP
jgi:hypothetical protein